MANIEFDLDADIVPGQSAAGIRLGMAEEELPSGGKKTLLTTTYAIEWPDVRVWIPGGRVAHIGVMNQYRGKIKGTSLGIGSTIAEVEAVFGPVIENIEDALVVESCPGWFFDSSPWSTPNGEPDKNARIVEIYVLSVLD